MNSFKNDPFSGFFNALYTIWGSLFLFTSACITSYLLFLFQPDHFFPFEILTGWIGVLLLSTLIGAGIPVSFVLFWTLFRFLYSDDSRIRLFFITTVAESVSCMSPYFLGNDHDLPWTRFWIATAFLVLCFFVLKKLGLLRNECAL